MVYVQISWNKIPYHFLLTPGPDPLTGEACLEVTLTPSLCLMTPTACPDNRLLERKPGLSTDFPSRPHVFFSMRNGGAAMPARAPAHWVEKDITEHNVALGLCPCWLLCELSVFFSWEFT